MFVCVCVCVCVCREREREISAEDKPFRVPSIGFLVTSHLDCSLAAPGVMGGEIHFPK